MLALLLLSLVALPADAAGNRELRVALTQEPGTLSPIVGTLAIESDLVQFLFSGLTRYDERGEQVPDLAVRVPSRANGDIAADGRSITYHLVHNARWHDGVPVTSADVAFTFSALMNPKNQVGSTNPYDKIARVDTPDPYTARLVLKQPWAPAIDAFSDRIDGAIVPAHLLKAYSDLNHVDFNAAPIGSGPYRFVAWHRGSDIELAANPDYFRGKPNIDRVIVRFLANDNTMLIAIRTHDVDVADRLNISTYSNLGPVPGMLPAINTQSFWEHLTFNTRHVALDDRRVRLALCYGFDLREILAKVAHGLGALGPTNQNPATPWYNRKLTYYPYDPVRAGRLLDEAGWKMGPDGVRSKGGQRLSLTLNFTAGNVTRDQTGVLLQQRWKQIGVETVIKTYPAATFYAPAAFGGPLFGGKTDIALMAFVQAVPDPNGVAVNNADAIPPHGNNLSFYANPELTRLENEAAATPVVAQRKALYDRIQVIELRELPYYVIRWSEITDMRSADLEGVRPSLIGSTFWNVADWKFRQ
jgi:peptide/nickel transport system substrate-binding protein